PGDHELVALRADGTELDRRHWTVPDDRHAGFLYAPGRSTDTCFFHERVTYSESEQFRDRDVVRLDPSVSFYTPARKIDSWFESPPPTVELRSGSSTAERRAIRVAPCSAKTVP